MNRKVYAAFLETLMAKIRNNSEIDIPPKNVVIGESLGMLHFPDGYFPRAELLISKQKYNGFIDQRIVDRALRFSIGLHIKRADNVTTDEDMYDALDLGDNLMKLIYSLHDDAIANGRESICPGFISMSGFPEIFTEYELFPKVTSVILVAEAEVQLDDTH